MEGGESRGARLVGDGVDHKEGEGVGELLFGKGEGGGLARGKE